MVRRKQVGRGQAGDVMLRLLLEAGAWWGASLLQAFFSRPCAGPEGTQPKTGARAHETPKAAAGMCFKQTPTSTGEAQAGAGIEQMCYSLGQFELSSSEMVTIVFSTFSFSIPIYSFHVCVLIVWF